MNKMKFAIVHRVYVYLLQAIECLTTVKKVNKTDAATLMNTFKVCSIHII